MGVPKPTAIMPMTSGEKESTGGEPTPTSSVLQETGRVSSPFDANVQTMLCVTPTS